MCALPSTISGEVPGPRAISHARGRLWVQWSTTRRSRSTGVANPTPGRANLRLGQVLSLPSLALPLPRGPLVVLVVHGPWGAVGSVASRAFRKASLLASALPLMSCYAGLSLLCRPLEVVFAAMHALFGTIQCRITLLRITLRSRQPGAYLHSGILSTPSPTSPAVLKCTAAVRHFFPCELQNIR